MRSLNPRALQCPVKESFDEVGDVGRRRYGIWDSRLRALSVVARELGFSVELWRLQLRGFRFDLQDVGDKLLLKFKHVRDAFKPLNLQRPGGGLGGSGLLQKGGFARGSAVSAEMVQGLMNIGGFSS